SASNLVTGSAGLSSTGFGQVTIFKRDILKSKISNFKSEISKQNALIQFRFYDQGLGFASWDLNHRGHREAKTRKGQHVLGLCESLCSCFVFSVSSVVN